MPSLSSNYYQPPGSDERGQALDLAMDNSRFKRSDQRFNNSTLNPPQNTGPYSAPSANSTPFPDRTYTPVRASTMGSANDLDRRNVGDQADYTHHARSDDLNHGSSAWNNSNFNGSGSLPGPSPAFMRNASRPNTPPGSGQQQQLPAPQYQGSSSGHSERSERRLSATSHSSVSSVSKSVPASSSSAATSVAIS